jgi:Ser/Thr protein kinase RdoA (MazF antagonist)
MAQAPMSEQLQRAGEEFAHAALARWGLRDCALRFVNHSENTTYFATPPGAAEPVVLRVHREGYHTLDGIRSELAWMRALEAEAGVRTPQAIPGLDGADVQTVAHPSLPRPRQCVLFAFIAGAEPQETDDLEAPFRQLGEVTARTHGHSEGWRRPPWFQRLNWDFEHVAGATPNWGRWQEGPDMTPARERQIGRMVDLMERRLARFGRAPSRFGLIHADFRLANLLVHEGDTRVIDFDDSGIGWFLYDAATAVSFFEHDPRVDALMASWCEGYRRVRPLPAEDEAELWTFIMLRRMACLAWMGSHHDTELARTAGPAYSEGSCMLAERYLTRFG